MAEVRMGDANEKILRVYTRLDSLKKNLPKPQTIHEKYVREYHSIVDELEKITSSDLAEFKVPDAEIKPHSNYIRKEIRYSRDKYCERSFLLAKLDGLLGYFQIKYLSEEKREIGFKRNE